MTHPELTTVAMDPPWQETGGGKIKRGADRHYPVLSKFQILQVIAEEPRFNPNLDGCSLWVWATRNFLPDALWLIEQLGARYVTDFTWRKGEEMFHCGRCGMIGTRANLYEKNAHHWATSGGLYCVRLSVPDYGQFTQLVKPGRPGLGQRSRSSHEHLLFARWGSVPIPEPSNRVNSVIVAPTTTHSAKPDKAYRAIERHDPPGHRLEMFARAPREGWAVHGNEIPEP